MSPSSLSFTFFVHRSTPSPSSAALTFASESSLERALIFLLLLFDFNELRTVSDYYQGPWAMIGDFNEMVNPDEKFGGASFNYSRARVDCMNTCGMIDLGYTGPKFTWVGKKDNKIIRERQGSVKRPLFTTCLTEIIGRSERLRDKS